MSRHYVTILGFCIGLMIDMFYDTVGVHAFALTATAYARGLMLILPRATRRIYNCR